MGDAADLYDGPHWELEGPTDSVRFFRGLAAAFPSATTLFVEGSPTADVDAFLRSVVETGPYLPKTGTIWPKPRLYRERFDGPTLDGLAALAANHAEPELCSSLHVYASDQPLLQWWEAFESDGPADAAPGSDPALLRAFAEAAGFRLAGIGVPPP